MLRLTFTKQSDATVETRDFPSIDKPEIAQSAFYQLLSHMRRMEEVPSLSTRVVDFMGHSEPITLDTKELYAVDWEYIP